MKARNILAVVLSAAYAAVANGEITAPTAMPIQRTLNALEKSTAANPARVRMLFYGQSIVEQGWHTNIVRQLKERYPTAILEVENRAIGGFTSPDLIRTAESDLYPYYPDILFFHVYGPTEKYEAIIRKVRETTTAEIVLWTSHLASYDKEPAELLEKRDARSLGILEAAEKYHCHIIDLNDKWCRHLVGKELKKGVYLADGIHLNGAGQMQYKDYIEEELIRIPGSCGDEAATGCERFFPVGDGKCVKTGSDGTLTFSFDGNRVVAVSDGTADAGLDAEVLLDGKPLAGMPELWAATRPTPLIMWFPGLQDFSLGPAAPVEEDWTLEILPPRGGDPTTNVFHAIGEIPRSCQLVPARFKVTGSVTGEDGEGITSDPFVSKSGRLSIPVRAWALWPHWKGNRPAPGAKTFWSVHPMFTDRLKPMEAGEEKLLVQGCSKGRHELTIKLPKGAKSGIAGFKVWTPAKQ